MAIVYDVHWYLEQPPTILVIYLFYMLLVCILHKIFSCFKVAFPLKLNLVLFATIIGVLVSQYDLSECLKPEEPEALLHLFHPFLILRVTYYMDTRLFMKALPHILALSTVGVAIFTCLMGGAVVLWTDVNLYYLPLYGLALASIDDPEFSQHVQEFEDMKYAIVILQGEYVFSATTSLFGLEMVRYCLLEEHIEWYQYILIFLMRIVGALISGCIIGKCASCVLLRTGEATHVAFIFLNTTFFTYYFSSHILRTSATLTTFIVAYMMTSIRSKLYKDTDVVVNKILDSVFFVIETFCYLAIWLIVMLCSMSKFNLGTFVEYLVIYIISLISRLFVLLAIYPIFMRVHRWSIKPFIALFWLTKRGVLQLLIYHLNSHYSGKVRGMLIFSTHSIFLVVYHLILNGAFGPAVLNIFGITTLSTQKMVNVHNSVRILNVEKERFLSIMKLNRFYMDAKWTEFDGELTLKTKVQSDDENFHYGQPRESRCEECNKEILMEPSKREFRMITLAAKQRVLQATKISYARQQEKGMLSKTSLKILLKMAEDSNDPKHNYFIDADNIKLIFRRTGWPEKVREVILTYVHTTKKYKIPRKPFRRICYHIVLHKYYELYIYLFMVLLFITDIVAIFVSNILQLATKVTCALVFALDMFMKINAYSHIYLHDGFRTHFTDMWNTFDFLILLTTLLEIMPYFHHFYNKMEKNDIAYETALSTWSMFVNCANNSLILVRMLRLLKIMVLLFHFRDEMIQFCNKYINNRIMVAYEIGKAVTVAYQESLHSIDTYTFNDMAKRQLIILLNEDMKAVYKEMDFAQMTNPTACMTIKTRYAINITMCYLWKEVEALKTSGFIDDFIFQKIKEGMEKCKIRALVRMRKIKLISPEEMFYELPWLNYFYEHAELMYSNSMLSTFKAKQDIHDGKSSLPGIYVILDGIVSMNFNPNTKAKLSWNGMLPGRDYVEGKYFEKTVTYLARGNSMGEYAMLSDTVYDASLTAVTPVKLLLLPIYKTKKVLVINEDLLGLPDYIWKYLSYNIVVEVLWEVPLYKSYSREDIMEYINKGFVPNTTKNWFIASGLIEDIVLFQGQIQDYNSGETYTAPQYLPRNVQNIRFNNNRQVPVKLFVIPFKKTYIKAIMDHSIVADVDVTNLRFVETKRLTDVTISHRRSNKTSFVKHKRKTI